jgi:DNA invertase Pin-like site-specific DNA recombinase
MQKLLDFLDTNGHKEAYVVLIDDIKRLARDVVSHFQLRKAILSRKATLESPSHKFGESPEEIFAECILAATAELERNQNRRQVYNRMKARLEAGYWPFYPPPGYAFAKVTGHGKLLVRREPEASIIREALEGFASGRLPTQVDVQRFLQSKDFKARGRRKRIHLEQVKRLLTQELYAGYISYPPWHVASHKGHHEPLIHPDTFECIQERLEERKKLPPRKDLHQDFPLRGFVLCSDCRNPYTASWSKGRNALFPYYRCHTLGCPFRFKSVRADLMHAEFEELLGKLRPRENILQIVRVELLDHWNRRMLDVATLREERKRKLDAIQKEISGYLTAVERCSNPTVIQQIEERVEALEAKKLRLGGRIPKPQQGDYDFATALDRVLDFIKNPLLMWKTGDLRQRQLVLRLIFSDPLVYSRETGFATATFSLPVKLSCVPELDKLEMVDMVRKSCNRLEQMIREWYVMLNGLPVATN